MKSLLKPFLFIIVVASVVSCTKEDENNPSTGSTNQTDPRSVFVGTWVCNEESQVFGTTAYSIDIATHSTITNRIVASNFYNLGFTTSNAQLEVSGSNITILQQNLSGYDVVGSGTLVSSSTINLSYTTDDGSGIDTVSAVYTKTN
jgi:hypothetical protein